VAASCPVTRRLRGWTMCWPSWRAGRSARCTIRCRMTPGWTRRWRRSMRRATSTSWPVPGTSGWRSIRPTPAPTSCRRSGRCGAFAPTCCPRASPRASACSPSMPAAPSWPAPGRRPARARPAPARPRWRWPRPSAVRATCWSRAATTPGRTSSAATASSTTPRWRRRRCATTARLGWRCSMSTTTTATARRPSSTAAMTC